MKIRLSITQKFLAPTLIVLVLLGVILNNQASSIVRHQAIGNAKNIIADFVRLQSKQHLTSPADFSPVDQNKIDQVFGKVFEEVKTPDMLRIKVWDQDGTVIFSDDKSIIGKNFRESNKNFQKSIGGEIVAVIKAPLAAENVTEKGYEQLMEVYIPIELRAGERPIGVVEAYYKLDRLNTSLLEAQRKISLYIALSFLLIASILWFLIKFVIIKPLKVLEMGIAGLKESGR